VFAARRVDDALGGLPALHVQPLGRCDARALLESALPARLDEPVLERIVAETRGNPLALLELPRGLTPTELAGGFGLPAALSDHPALSTRSTSNSRPFGLSLALACIFIRCPPWD
jgi:hypothetical protein